MKKFVALCAILLCTAIAQANTFETSATADTLSNNALYNKKNAIGWLARYLRNTNKKNDKAFDMSLVIGPSYSANTSFTIGAMACGLYSWDRSDTTLHKSDVSIFGTVGVTGMFAVGAEGKNYTKNDRWRLNYLLSLVHMPTQFWGIGYDCGNLGKDCYGKYRRLTLQFKPEALYRLGKRCYVGPIMDIDWNNAFDRKVCQHDERDPFIDTDGTELQTKDFNFGVGLKFNYDTRDNPLNAYKGVLLSFSSLYYPKVGSHSSEFGANELTFNHYIQTWKGAVVAYQLHGLYTYDDVPWTKLAQVGGTYRMRGYYMGRYRDENIMEGQVELRQHLWKRIGGVAWVGTANIWGRQDYKWSRWLPNCGVGFRWEFKQRVNVRIDCGFGKNDFNICFNINEAF